MYRDSRLGLCIDLSGPDGNAFVLMGFAKDFCRQLDKNFKQIQEKMTSGDYNNLVAVFEKEFPMVTLLNKPGEEEEE